MAQAGRLLGVWRSKLGPRWPSGHPQVSHDSSGHPKPAKSNHLKVWVNYEYPSESQHSPISAPITDLARMTKGTQLKHHPHASPGHLRRRGGQDVHIGPAWGNCTQSTPSLVTNSPRNGSLRAKHENDLKSTFAPLLRVVIHTFGSPPRQSTLITSRLVVGGFNNADPLPWSGW